MGEVTLTFDPKALERFIYIVIILVLAFFLFKAHVLDNPSSSSEEVTENSDTETLNSDSNGDTELLEADLEEETCSDGLKNQDETDVDCGGTCGGYYYSGKCNDEPEPECRFNSDCPQDHSCLKNECVKDEPECSSDGDCQSGYECKSGSCEKEQLSGKITYSLGTLNPVERDTHGELSSFQITINNGKSEDKSFVVLAYLYRSSSDSFYDIDRAEESFVVDAGDEVKKTISLSPKTFSPKDDDFTFKVEVYDGSTYDNADDPGIRLTKIEKKISI